MLLHIEIILKQIFNNQSGLHDKVINKYCNKENKSLLNIWNKKKIMYNKIFV